MAVRAVAVRDGHGRRRDARDFLEEHWRNIGEEPGIDGDGGLLRDIILINAISPPPVYLHFSGLGRGSGTGFSVTGLLDSPGSSHSICSASAVAGLHSVKWSDTQITVTAGGHHIMGRKVSAPISFSWAFGLGIGRGQWAVTHGVQPFVVVSDADFKRLSPGRDDCVALFGVDMARNPAFAPMVAKLQAALGDSSAPHVATHIMRSAWLGTEEIRGSQQVPITTLLEPLHDTALGSTGVLDPRNCDRAYNGAPAAGAADATAAQAAAPDALSAAAQPGFAPLDEHLKPSVAPATVHWTDADAMWKDVTSTCKVGDLSPGGLRTLKDILWRRREAFGTMTPRKLAALKLKLKPGAKPSKSGLLRFASPAQNLEIKRAMEEFSSMGVASEVTDPNHVARLNVLPIVLVAKPDGGWRFCIDFRELNALLDDTATTRLPDVAELLVSFAGCTMFTTLDELKCFNQVRVDDESMDWMAATYVDPVTKQRRYFRFSGAMLGLAPLTYLVQEGGEWVVSEVAVANPTVRSSCFVDDFSLGSGPIGDESVDSHEQRHLAALDTLLATQIVRGHVFTLKKGQLLVPQASIMGCTTNGREVTICPSRMAGWTHFRVPEQPSLKWLQSFLGTLIYCAPYLGPTYQRDSSILWDIVGTAERAHTKAQSTNDKAGKISAQRLLGMWGADHTAAAERCIKLAYDHASLLFWRPDQPAFIHADASDTGFCAYMTQTRADGSMGVVAIISRRWTANQRLWSVAAREMYGLLAFMRVHGNLAAFCPSATFFTDHLNLLTARDLEHAYVKRWLVELYQFPCFRALVHLPGRCNVLADFLSRWCVSEQDFAPVGATPAPATDDPSEVPWRTARRRGSALARGEDFPPDAVQRGDGHLLLPVRAINVLETVPPPAAPRPARKGRGGAAPPHETAFFSNPHSSQYSPLVTSILEAQWGLSAADLTALRAIPNVEDGLLDGRACLLHRGRLVVPPSVPQLVASLMDILHDNMLHAHTSKMQDALRAAGLYLPNAHNIMQHYCDTCPDCQRAAAPDTVPAYRARLLIHPRVAPWEHVFLDYATLPSTGSGGPSKLILVIDATTRHCILVPSATEDGAASAAALRQWCEHYPPVKAVHTDGGPAFKGLFLEFCAKRSITVDRGTAYNSKGRGLVERLVKKTKDALRRLVPPGRPEQWISYVGDLQSLLNRMPHKALGGLSPQQVAMGGAQPFLPHLFAGKQWDSNSQTWWDILEALRFLRTITEIAGEVSEVKQKIAYDAAVMHHAPYKVGDWCLVYHNERASSLDSFFRGPYLITDVQVDVRGDPSGFYSVAPLLANDTLSKDVLEVHAARLWPFNGERTSSCAEHWKRLPEGFGVVQDILNHRLHARGAQVLVRYYMVPRPTWEFTSSMREPHLGWNSIYKAYCETHGLPLEGGPQWHNAREDHNGSA